MKQEIASVAVSSFVSSQGSWVEHEQKFLVELPQKLKKAYIKSLEAVPPELDDVAQEIIERCRLPEFGTRKRKADGVPLGMAPGYGSPQAHTLHRLSRRLQIKFRGSVDQNRYKLDQWPRGGPWWCS